MSEQRERGEDGHPEKEEESTTITGGGTEEEPPEEGREPGRDGEEEPPERGGESRLSGSSRKYAEEAETQPDQPIVDVVDLREPPDVNGDVMENVEAAETQANMPEKDHQAEEPQKTDDVANSTATVKVVLVPEGHVMTVAFAIGLSILELKCHLASELRVPVEVLQLSLDGKAVEEQQSLMELGVRPHSSTRLEMNSSDPGAHPLRPIRPPEHDTMPDVITVQVQTDEGLIQEVVVEVERPRQQKAFLGGYRHRVTGTEFHHAAVQTLPKKRPDRGVLLFSRNTQTVEHQSKPQQCPVDVSTQMTGIGCYVSCRDDKLVSPGKYITSEQHHDRRLRAVLCLQSYARRWLAQQAVSRLKRERLRRLSWLEMKERKREEEKQEQLRERRQRWTNPQRREDFNLLYHALEKWRKEEEEQINATMRGAERKAALCALLEEETQRIAAIGRHRIAYYNNNYDKFIQNFLDKCAAPHRWRAGDGGLVEMDTPNILRARELRDLYSSISVFTVDKVQRQQHLMTLKHTVQEHQSLLTQEIVDLIDREVDLITRGYKTENLEGLRKRICTLFLQFIKTPAFNPRVAKMLKVPQDPSELKEDMFFCRSCQRRLRSADFKIFATGSRSSRCRRCTELDNIGRKRDEYFCYRKILGNLRTEEQRINDKAKIPFLLKVEDMQYLVEVIWGSRSALQASSDLYNLVFVRWERKKEWSPWNCILLSKEETSAHLEVEDVYKVYEMPFICGVEYKHSLARRRFGQISEVVDYLDGEPAAAQSNELVCRPVAMVTGTIDPTPGSAS